MVGPRDEPTSIIMKDTLITNFLVTSLYDLRTLQLGRISFSFLASIGSTGAKPITRNKKRQNDTSQRSPSSRKKKSIYAHCISVSFYEL